MKIKCFLIVAILLSVSFYSQNSKPEEEDMQYEMKHKSSSWFSKMKDGADYLKVKSKFDRYFGRYKWEKSKPRSLGEDWIRTKLFYLDNKGKVVPEPLMLDRPKTKNILSLTTQTQVGDWTMIGPVNSASTSYSSKFNHGGYVYLNRIDPTDSQKMFVSFVTGGLWRTIDGGGSWNLVDNGFPDSNYQDIDVCIANPQVVYALSDKQLIKSTDGGLNWTETSMVANSTFTGKAYDMAVSPVNSDTVVVRWGTKVYRTIDGGNIWTEVLNNLPNYSIFDSSIHSEVLEWDPTNGNSIFLCSISSNNVFKVYKSTDQGASFSELLSKTLDVSTEGQNIGWGKLFLPSDNTNSFYIAVGTGSSAYNHLAVQLYKFKKADGSSELQRINMVSNAANNSLNHGDIQMDRNDESKIVYGTYGKDFVNVSIDNGATFSTPAGRTHSDIRSIDLVGGKLVVGSDGEMAVSNDLGATLVSLTNSISNHELWGFGSSFKNNLVVSGNNHGPIMIKEAASGGFEWYNGPGADEQNTDVNPLDDRYIYSRGYNNYRLFRTGIHTLSNNQSNFLDLGIQDNFNSLEFHPNKYYTIITQHAGQYPTANANLATWENSLIKTEDNGDNISIVKTFNSRVMRNKISAKNPKTMIVVEGLTNNKLWKTTDEGINWTNITPTTITSSGQTNISDIAIGDEDSNEIWVTYSGVQSVCKVLKSNDGGTTWANLTDALLTTSPITKIIFQRGSNGGVYVGNKAGVFYRNDIMSNWVMLGNGLPMCDVRFMFINYNENKLKIGTSRGAFEHGLYEISPPNALISVDYSKITCPTIGTQFKDYSVVRNASANWQWSFPGGTPSSSTLENPIISYVNAANGHYDVTLTVTDQYGTSTQTLNDFIEVNNICGTSQPDKIPGNSVNLTGQTNQDYIQIDDLNLNKNSFTFSCWIKPNGIQPDYSAIFMSQTDLNPFGMNFMNGDNTIGFHPSYTFNSELVAPPNKWSHIALVSDGNIVKLYVNGVEKIHNGSIPSEVFNTLFLGNYGRGMTDRFTNLEMDEVAIWNRALTIEEIRKWRHLTKSIAGEPILNGLVYYLQFDESGGSVTLNKNNTSSYAKYSGSGYTRITSNAPVFEGVSEKININSSGLKDFTTVGVSMEFPPSGTYPNGDVWVSRGTINPDQPPNNNVNFGFYTIVNNYGTNQTFIPLTSLSFYNNAAFGNYLNPASYKLFQRTSNDFGNTWGSSIDGGDNISGSGNNTKITFNNGLNISSLGQLDLTIDFSACYRPGATSGTILTSRYGITSLGRAGASNGNWPMVRKGVWAALESKSKGFVVNRLTTVQKTALIAVEGMMVYDTDLDCLSIYNGLAWKCFNIQTCPQ